MLKIAMVAESARLRESDAEQRVPHLTALAGALAAAGDEVTVYVRGEHATTAAQGGGSRGFHVVGLTGRFGPALSDRLRTDRPDVVHAHCGSVWEAAAGAARALRVPFVFSMHSAADTPCPGREAHVAADRSAAQAADHVLAAYSGQIRALGKAGVPRWQTSLVPYGVDVDHFNPDGAPAPSRRTANRVIALGALSSASGFGSPVAALRALPDTELLVVGGPQHGQHARELRDYARSLGVAQRVRLAGPVPNADLPGLLRSADVLVCSPWEPTFGAPALEGMACGVAVVANRLGGLADTVVDNITGVHVTPHKPRELATTLLRLLRHKPLREQQGAAGRDRVWARYSWPHIAADTVHAYRRAGAVEGSRS